MPKMTEGKTKGHQSNFRVNLIELPDVVLRNISKYFDPSSIKKLRLVSRAWKSWAEQPYSLQKLRMVIDSPSRVQTLISSSIRWNSVAFSEALGAQDLVPWLEYSKTFLKKIQIKNCMRRSSDEYYLLTILNNVGPSLSSLCFKSSGPLDEYKYPQLIYHPIRWKQLTRNLSGLRELRFEDFVTSTTSSTEYKFVDYFLSLLLSLFDLCTNLRDLGLPTFSWEGCNCPEKYKTQSSKLTFAILSLFDQLELGERSSLKTIDLHSAAVHFSWFSPQLFSVDLRATPADLLRLLMLSQHFGVKLYNFPAEGLPTSPITVDAQFEAIEPQWVKAIGSLVVRNVRRGLDDYYLPPNCPVRALHWVRAESKFSRFEYKLPSSSHVTSLSVVFGQNTLTSIPFQQLLRVVRPTLTELRLEGITDRLVGRLQLGQTFPNLKVLELYNFEPIRARVVWIKFAKLLDGLVHLEELTLSGLKVELTNQEELDLIEGIQHPAFKYLKFLKWYSHTKSPSGTNFMRFNTTLCF